VEEGVGGGGVGVVWGWWGREERGGGGVDKASMRLRLTFLS